MLPSLSLNAPNTTQRQGLVLMKNIPESDLSIVLDATHKAVFHSESDPYVMEAPSQKGKSSTRRYTHSEHVIYQLVQASKSGDTYTQALISVPTHVSEGKAQMAEDHARKKENVLLSTLKAELDAHHLLETYLPKDGTIKNLYYMNSSPLDFMAGVQTWQDEKHQRIVDVLDDSSYDLSKVAKKEDRLFHPIVHHTA
ncbi:MAG: hypothetical protein LW809_04475 [Vampirovibrionales bacterium]|jgi:hypothetical protein|nr:hypothetical protein [Vampirovibrionales bacterium]